MNICILINKDLNPNTYAFVYPILINFKNFEKLTIKFGDVLIIQNGKLNMNYKETDASEYMKNDNIEIIVDISSGSKNFSAYTMDLTKKYVDINADYRS